MPYLFPPLLDQLVREEMASGEYDSEDDLLLTAMQSLCVHRETMDAIRKGLADIEAGRTRPAEDFFAEIHAKYEIPENQ
jgi:predicted transcriptional regulator